MAVTKLHAWTHPKRLMVASIGVAMLTIALKALAWWLTGSVGLLSDAMESFVNLAAAMFGLLMVTVAARPADADHPFGHSKAEYFSSGFEGVLILAAAAAIVWTALPRFWQPRPIEQLGWGIALSIVSAALNGVLAIVMLGAARQARSIALEGGAKHLMADVWTSAGVVIGLLLARVSDWLWLDPLVAVVVALNIAREAARLIWRSSQGLMDAVAEPHVKVLIDAALARFAQVQVTAMRPGNETAIGARRAESDRVYIDDVITRRAGRQHFVSLHMHVPQGWSLGHAAALRAQLERELVEAVPFLQISIQLLPLGVEPLTRPGAPRFVESEQAGEAADTDSPQSTERAQTG